MYDVHKMKEQRTAKVSSLDSPTITGKAVPASDTPVLPDLESAQPLLAAVRRWISEGRLDLPVASQLVKHAERLYEATDTTLDSLLAIVESEPAVAACIVRVANSRAAVERLGLDKTRNAIQLIAQRSTPPPESAQHHLRRLWTNTLFTAVAAREIARWLGHSNPDNVYMAALFANVGEAILVRAFAEQDPEDITVFYSSDVVVAAVREEHASIGRALLASWHFPGEAVELAGTHEGPINRELVAIITAASEAALDYGYTYLDVFPNRHRLHRALTYLGLSKTQLDGLPGEIGEELNRALTFTG